MVKFCISTDSGCDMPVSFFKERDVAVFPMKYIIDDEEFCDTMDPAGSHEFFEKMRGGAAPHTSQMNEQDFLELWGPLLARELPIVHIALSSGISGTYANALIARETFMAAHPQAVVYVHDSRTASMGVGLQVDYSADLRDKGATAEECVAWLSENVSKVNSWYTPDDLKYLHRGGRVSATSAIVGTMLDIKPILNVDDLGRLTAREKVKGRKKVLRRMAEITMEKVVDPQSQKLYVCHADCREEAAAFSNVLSEQAGFKEVFLSDMGPIIGSHTGPGLITLFFLGQKTYR